MFKKAKTYTPQQEAFLEALRDPECQGDLRTAMDVAGYAKTAPVATVMRALKDEIIEIAKEILAANASKAAHAIVKGVVDADGLTAVRSQNAERILDRVGIVKGEKITMDQGPTRIAILPRRKEE